eukprot:m.135932 g.135932  ORF g.135932 m.135932 type:complete len:1063 (+) comp16014_c0_seq1:99-3287(+)
MAKHQVQDLAQLPELTEGNIIKALKGRYERQDIHTYLGDILLVVNPYEHLPIYTPDHHDLYKGAVGRNQAPPHVFYLANQAYEEMIRSKTDQCFIISGESGAGKTETTKRLLQHVVLLCRAGKTSLEHNIATVNVLLEAFGNAKTAMNDNSSRFGKLLTLQFDPTGAVVGVEVAEYLLEKSRVCHHGPLERNYHVFYYLLHGAEASLLTSCGIADLTRRHYLHGSKQVASSAEQARCKRAWDELLSTFKRFGFDTDEVEDVIRLLGAILQLGDVQFEAQANDSSVVTADSKVNLDHAGRLLGVGAPDLEQALTSLRTVTRGEEIRRCYTHVQAAGVRDALAKALYARLFSWLINACNGMLRDDEADLSSGQRCLGILDIFGFEIFDSNGLGQLCINIANERLQSFFNTVVFEAEQAELEAEGVTTTAIAYTSNQPVIDLCLGANNSIYACMQEEAKLPGSSDATLIHKLHALTKHPSKAYSATRSERDLAFSVKHFAGKVLYSVAGALDQNRDVLPEHLVSCMLTAQSFFVLDLFRAKRLSKGSFLVETKRRPSRVQRGGRKAQVTTLLGAFKESLSELMTKLDASKPTFIRCIKPNAKKAAKDFDKSLVLQQLKCAGVLETVRIRKEGFAIRLTFADFAKRYRNLHFEHGSQVTADANNCSTIAKALGLTGFQVGTHKIFLKYHHSDILTKRLQQYRQAYGFVKAVLRGYIARYRYRGVLVLNKQNITQVASFLSSIELIGDTTQQWCQRLRQEDEDHQADRVAMVKPLLEAVKTPSPTPSDDGMEAAEQGRVLSRDGNLTMRVGKLPSHWEKKVDPVTGRAYFKNHQSRETTWVDPRSAAVRKFDAAETEGDELPFGWDQAETADGEIYYIDHNTEMTHWLHPRLLLDQKRKEFEELEQAASTQAESHRRTLAMFRAKRQLLDMLQEQALDDDEALELQARVAAMDDVIDKELKELQGIMAESAGLKSEIHVLKQQFQKSAYEAEHGAGSYFEGDVEDRYALEREATLPRPLNTLQRDGFSRKSTVHNHEQQVKTKDYSNTMRRRFFGRFGKGKKKKGKS